MLFDIPWVFKKTYVSQHGVKHLPWKINSTVSFNLYVQKWGNKILSSAWVNGLQSFREWWSITPRHRRNTTVTRCRVHKAEVYRDQSSTLYQGKGNWSNKQFLPAPAIRGSLKSCNPASCLSYWPLSPQHRAQSLSYKSSIKSKSREEMHFIESCGRDPSSLSLNTTFSDQKLTPS